MAGAENVLTLERQHKKREYDKTRIGRPHGAEGFGGSLRTESDKNNHDYYREIFTPDVKLKVYFGDKLGMDINNVEDMIARYKAFGAAKASFHQNGQQVVNFTDDCHATGTCYAIATLVTEETGKDKLTLHAVRYTTYI